MAQPPPSYQDTLDALPPRYDWLILAAPYVLPHDYPALCAVSRSFEAVFAPRLWRDPLVAARWMGVDASDDLSWYTRFIRGAAHHRPSTRAHVLSLDFRRFGQDAYHFASSDHPIPASFPSLPTLFPNLRCVLLDGHTGFDPAALVSPQVHAVGRAPELLSFANCRVLPSPKFFGAPRLRSIICLDVSGMSGSLRALLTQNLPNIRVLKARRREANDSDAADLVSAFAGRLWSLDLCENRLSDVFVDRLIRHMVRGSDLRTQDHFEVEGKLACTQQGGSEVYGPFLYVQESSRSGSFSHPDRYVADAPVYSHLETSSGPPSARTDGRTPAIGDSTDCLHRALTDTLLPQQVDAVRTVCALHSPNVPLTHLHIASNRLTTRGLERLLRSGSGRLQYIDCADARFTPPRPFARPWPRSTVIKGLLPPTHHIFRPVWSPDLRGLRAHHSLVTNVPSLEAKGLTALSCLAIAETHLLSTIEQAFPYSWGWVPDANPRINVLVLTGVPRRSFGPVAQRLVRFLSLLEKQEVGIRSAREESGRRGPACVAGLRRLRLEMDDELSNDEEVFLSGAVNGDSEEVFSFFDGERETNSEITPRPKLPKTSTAVPVASRAQDAQSGSATPPHPSWTPVLTPDGAFVTHKHTYNTEQLTSHIWIGPPHPMPEDTSFAVQEYARRVETDVRLRDCVVVASPAHVAAGVPAGSLLFADAWDSMIALDAEDWKKEEGRRRAVDVLEVVRAYRLRRVAEGGGWRGKLEVVMKRREP